MRLKSLSPGADTTDMMAPEINDDAEYRAYLGQASNPLCPDHSAHSENAADRLVPGWTRRLLTAEEQALVDAEADLEYMNCEGH